MIIKSDKKYTMPLMAAMLSSVLACSFLVNAQSEVSGVDQQVTQEVFSQAQLEQMLAPIALYPDSLLTHILIAATYPIEVIDADRFVKQHQEYSEQDIIANAEQKSWDPSVKALLAFPKILDNLSKDLNWMRNLGDAFLQDEAQVLASIQSLRNKADEAGNLAQMDNVAIVRDKQTIIIEPAQAEVIYVPYYDTRVVYGNWHWSHYPPVYWHRPAYYSYYHGPFYWRSGVHIAFDFFFSAFHWHNHHVVRHHHKQRYYHSNRRIATSHHATRWHHNPNHRKGVAYRTDKVKHRYVSNRPSTMHTVSKRKHHSNTLITHRQGGAHKKLVGNKHQEVKQRLILNRAVKVNQGGEHKQKMPAKVERGDKFVTPPARQRTTKLHRQDSWKKQPNVKMVTPIQPQKNMTVRKRTENNYQARSVEKTIESKNDHYRAQGGHSSKAVARVANNNSSRKRSPERSRQKHH